MKPTSRYIWLLVLGLPLAALPTLFGGWLWPVYLVFVGALILVTLVDLVSLRGARPQVEITAPTLTGVGDPLAVEVRLVLPTLLPLVTVLRAQTTTPLGPGEDVSVRLEPGVMTLTMHLTAMRRGVGQIQALWFRFAGATGLVERIVRVPVRVPEIKVVPSLPRVRQLAIEYFGTWRFRGGVRLTRLRGVGSEFDALQAYVPGMDPRHVDWNASARHQALRVRQYRVEQNQRIIISLDCGRLMADPIEGIQRLDHSLHASMLLSYFALRDGDQVGLHAYSHKRELWVPGRGGLRHFQTITEAGAGLQPRETETNHVLGIHDLMGRLKRRTLVIVLTEFSDATTAELMVDYLGLMARQHLVIFMALEDPVLADASRVRPAAPEDLARALAANSLHRDRAAVLHRLRRRGVHVVSGLPGMAAVQLVMQYTAIKRRELIG